MIKTLIRFQMEDEKLLQRMRAKRKRVLYKTGGYTLRSMQRSMRYRKKASNPKFPPSAHRENGALLRKLSHFVVNEKNGTVVIGPIKLGGDSQPSGKPVPELLDKGGPVEALVNGQSVITTLEPRPFVDPAFTDGGRRYEQLLERERL